MHEYLKFLFEKKSFLYPFIYSSFISIISIKQFIFFGQKYFCSNARVDTPKHHALKKNIPTMGGLFFFIAAILVTILLTQKISTSLLCIFLSIVGFGAIGFLDDWKKIKYKIGIYAKTKFYLQIICSTIIVSFLLVYTELSSGIYLPFSEYILVDWKPLFICWAIFIILACSNAVNLTDGLDGLAAGTMIPNILLYSYFVQLEGHDQLAIFGYTLTGTLACFLYYNFFPAKIFMGDIGSLCLGATLALFGLITKKELLIPITGSIFFIETISVIAQVVWFKKTKKRLFLMAPLHHHFELSGWHEKTITSVAIGITWGLCTLIFFISH